MPVLPDNRMLDPGLIAILRANRSDHFPKACEALVAAGVRAIELTMTTPNALQSLVELRRDFGGEALFGMGSVLDVATARLAIEAGAGFIVTPVLKPEVIAFCKSERVPICGGSYTPTEAQTSYELGADFIKIFPADGLGPKFIKGILGPLPHLKIIPTGGVDLHTAAEFIKAGCVAVAAGSTLVTPGVWESGDWAHLREHASNFVEKVRAARG